MQLKEEQIDLLGRFLRNEMTEADQAAWKKMMRNKAVKDEIRNMTHLHESIKAEGRERIRAELNAWDHGESQKQVDRTGHNFSPWRWIAAAVLFIAVTAVLLFRQSDPTPESLFDNYYEPYPNMVAPVRKDAPADDPFTQAFQLYEMGNYQEAYELFRELPNRNAAIVFYTGMCQIELDHLEEARAGLQTLKMIPGHPYFLASDWYLALLELKTGSIAKAKIMFGLIAADDDHPFHQRALQMEEALDQVKK